MTAPFNPEELCDQTLIGSIRMLMKDDSVFPEIFSAAFENRNANNLVFSIPSDLSITGKQIDVIADRAHLLKESQYRPHEWNAWPDVRSASCCLSSLNAFQDLAFCRRFSSNSALQ